MKFLLDTSCWLWLQTAPSRFNADLLETLTDYASQRHLSSASVWEIAIKYSIGKLPLPQPPAVYIPDRMRLNQFQELAITHVHAVAVAGLPPHHRDPFDRILIAQAQLEGMTLITSDASIEQYDVSTVRI